MDGAARLRRWRDELRGVPPAVGRLGARLGEVEPGRTTVRLPVTPELSLPGRPSAAAVAMVADVVLTTSVVASLPGPQAVTTVTMTLDLLRPPPADGELVAVGRCTPYAEGAPQHCAGTVRDAAGAEVALISGWFVPNDVTAGASDRQGVVTEPAATDVLDLLGLRAGEPWQLHARDALSNVAGTLHGGVGALACVVAAEDALGPDFRPLTCSLGYLRPTPRDGTVTVSADVVRRGRRTATVSSALTADDGRPVLQAVVTAVAG